MKISVEYNLFNFSYTVLLIYSIRVDNGIFFIHSQLHAISKLVFIPLSRFSCSLSLTNFKKSILANSPNRSIPALNPSPRSILFASSKIFISYCTLGLTVFTSHEDKNFNANVSLINSSISSPFKIGVLFAPVWYALQNTPSVAKTKGTFKALAYSIPCSRALSIFSPFFFASIIIKGLSLSLEYKT